MWLVPFAPSLSACYRFEMSKKKLNTLTFDSIKEVCLVLMENWLDTLDESEPSLDKDFLASLKELKTLVDREKEHRNIVCSRLQAAHDIVSPKACAEIENNFKVMGTV